MELRRIIPSDITASAVAHVSLLTLLVLFSDVRPFGAVTAEQIPVEIVTPQDLAERQMPAEQPAEQKPEPMPSPQPDFTRRMESPRSQLYAAGFYGVFDHLNSPSPATRSRRTAAAR